jgi:hypothetical protein
MKDNLGLGLGPRIEEVTWVARGLRKMLGSKYRFVVGGSCWISGSLQFQRIFNHLAVKGV